MIGFKITATYTANNIMQTPDPGGGAWGDAMLAWGDIIASALTASGPAGPPTSAFVDYVNTSDALNPTIRVVTIWDIGVQAPYNLATVLSDLGTSAASGPALATLADFDSVGSMSYVSSYLEQWSDEKTI